MKNTSPRLLSLVFSFQVLMVVAHAKQCQKVNNCACKQDDGGIVDLSPVVNNTIIPRFSAVQDVQQTQNKYYWNPCSSFSLEGDCAHVAVCLEKFLTPNNTFYALGTQKSAKFGFDENDVLQISYSVNDNGTVRTAVISLVCGSLYNDNFTVFGESNPGYYYMQLSSVHACPSYPIPTKPASPTNKDTSLSGGWIFVIVIVCLLSSYCIMGALFNKYVGHKEGAEIMPHYNSLSSGCSYVAKCLPCGGRSKVDYDAV